MIWCEERLDPSTRRLRRRNRRRLRCPRSELRRSLVECHRSPPCALWSREVAHSLVALRLRRRRPVALRLRRRLRTPLLPIPLQRQHLVEEMERRATRLPVPHLRPHPPRQLAQQRRERLLHWLLEEVEAVATTGQKPSSAASAVPRSRTSIVFSSVDTRRTRRRRSAGTTCAPPARRKPESRRRPGNL